MPCSGSSLFLFLIRSLYIFPPNSSVHPQTSEVNHAISQLASPTSIVPTLPPNGQSVELIYITDHCGMILRSLRHSFSLLHIARFRRLVGRASRPTVFTIHVARLHDYELIIHSDARKHDEMESTESIDAKIGVSFNVRVQT
ncbi:hypothetical protein V8C34DRAFT_259925 [Trichoderma compactum]